MIFLVYGEFYIKNRKTTFFGTITCKYMSRNVGMELTKWQENEHKFSCTTLNWLLLMLEQYGCPNTSTAKNYFSLTPFFSNSDSHFMSLRVSLSFANIWNKDVKLCLPLSLQHGEISCASWVKKYNYYREISFCHPKNLGLRRVIINSM